MNGEALKCTALMRNGSRALHEVKGRHRPGAKAA